MMAVFNDSSYASDKRDIISVIIGYGTFVRENLVI